MFIESDAVKAEVFDAIERAQSNAVTNTDIKLLNAYLAANLMFLSAQRPAAIRNMTIEEYNNKEENNEVESCHLIKVARHKTEALGPARLFASKEITSLMNIYLQHIRTVIKPQSKELQSRFFLTPTGNELNNLSDNSCIIF